MELKKYIRSIENYPIEGVVFRDITPVLQDGQAFKESISQLADLVKDLKFDKIAGVEARGFIVGAPLANVCGCGFIPIRKPGKLPYEKVSQAYDLEYGSASIEVHSDSIKKGERILIIDDLLATGGTAFAASQLIEGLGGHVVSCAFFIELESLQGRKNLAPYPVRSLLKY